MCTITSSSPSSHPASLSGIYTFLNFLLASLLLPLSFPLSPLSPSLSSPSSPPLPPSGMMMSSDAKSRPLSSKYLRPTSRPSHNTKPLSPESSAAEKNGTCFMYTCTFFTQSLYLIVIWFQVFAHTAHAMYLHSRVTNLTCTCTCPWVCCVALPCLFV